MKVNAFGILLWLFLILAPDTAAAGSPEIEVWYGPTQRFGQLGTPQQWANILGKVSGDAEVVSLSYRLNGGPEQRLSMGPDDRRLAAAGDFNIDIPIESLRAGANRVVIAAVDAAGNQTQATVELDYSQGIIWPLPFTVDWRTVVEIEDAAQVVDGQWQLTEDGVRAVSPGYDRLVAIGDMSWENYEVTVPITVHRAQPRFAYPSHGAMVGVILRWRGHTAWDEAQPADGWWPLGAIGQIQWVADGVTQVRLLGNKALPLAVKADGWEFQPGIPYLFKLRVESIPTSVTLYSFKLWQAAQPEPSSWTLVGQQRPWDPLQGSLLLAAHHVDATFGNVTVAPLAARSGWEWLTAVGPYLAQVPLLLACLAGMVLVWLRRSRAPQAARLALLGLALLLVRTLLATVIDLHLPLWLHARGWGTHEIGVTLLAVEGLLAGAAALAVGLLLWAFFGWSRPRGTP